jgi:hypothetical protein
MPTRDLPLPPKRRLTEDEEDNNEDDDYDEPQSSKTAGQFFTRNGRGSRLVKDSTGQGQSKKPRVSDQSARAQAILDMTQGKSIGTGIAKAGKNAKKVAKSSSKKKVKGKKAAQLKQDDRDDSTDEETMEFSQIIVLVNDHLSVSTIFSFLWVACKGTYRCLFPDLG